MPLTYISLFSGIGGFEVGIHKVFPDAVCLGYSEINPHSIKVYKEHFPSHPELGDVTEIKGKKFKGKVDLLVGGSPCQDLSLLNVAPGEGLNGKKSSLFFEYVRLLREIKPRYFILENVIMKNEYRDQISKMLKVEPVEITSRCVSLQNRRRLFWCNFDVKTAASLPPKDGIVKDICLKESDKRLNDITRYDCSVRSDNESKLVKGLKDVVNGIENERSKYYKIYKKTDKNFRTILASTESGGLFYLFVNEKKKIVRQMHPVEFERLQTFPDEWTSCLPKTHRYKTLGNAVVCDVIAEICKCIKM